MASPACSICHWAGAHDDGCPRGMVEQAQRKQDAVDLYGDVNLLRRFQREDRSLYAAARDLVGNIDSYPARRAQTDAKHASANSRATYADIYYPDEGS